MKRVLITGSEGFIGSNLMINLRYTGDFILSGFDKLDDPLKLKNLLCDTDFVFHLAGINRPENKEDFNKGNAELTELIVDFLIDKGLKIPLILSSSTQAELDNDYGRSKLEAEKHVRRYMESGGKGYIYRLTNVFGKWCRPNYNSVVATFCSNIAQGKEIYISDGSREMDLIHVDDVITSFRRTLENDFYHSRDEYMIVKPSYRVTLDQLADMIRSFKENSRSVNIPDIQDDLVRKLHSTYLSYLPVEDAVYPLNKQSDERGYLFELLKSKSLGQIFVSKTLPGITRGNHFHHLKNEKFCVIEGSAVIKFRHLITNKIHEFHVSGEKPEAVNILPGYTHSITNTGDNELITLFWANEPFDKNKPDTFFEKV